MVKIGVDLHKLSQNQNWGITFWTFFGADQTAHHYTRCSFLVRNPIYQ